jgi:hypothetical protein
MGEDFSNKLVVCIDEMIRIENEGGPYYTQNGEKL